MNVFSNLSTAYNLQSDILAHPSTQNKLTSFWNIFNVFGLSGSSQPEEVSATTDVQIATEQGATTTDGSMTAVVAEAVNTVEPAAPVQATNTSIPSQATTELPASAESENPTHSAETAPQTSSGTSTSPASESSNQPPTPDIIPSAAPPTFNGDGDIVEWAKRKVETQEKMSNADFLSMKKYFEDTRRELPFEPITLRFAPRCMTPPAAPHVDTSTPGAPLSQQPPLPTFTETYDPSAEGPAYYSAFHSSNSLPTFKNNVRPCYPRKVSGKPPIRPDFSHVQESRKRPAPQIRLDPHKRRRLLDRADVSGTSNSTESRAESSNIAESGPSVPPKSPPRQKTPPRRNRQITPPRQLSPLREVINQPPPSPPRPTTPPRQPSPLHDVVNRSPPSPPMQTTPPRQSSQLRDVVNQPPPSPPRQTNAMPTNLNASSSNASRPTYTAAFVQEIVRNTPTRAKHPDVENPYQRMQLWSPRPYSKLKLKRLAEWRTMKNRSRKNQQGAKAKEPEKKKELSAREIIEATIPKSAKRSRPPPDLTGSQPTRAFNRAPTRKRSLEDAEEERPTTRKQRRIVTVEEVSDDDDNVWNRRVAKNPAALIESRSPSPEPAPGPARPQAEAPSPTDPFVNGQMGRTSEAQPVATAEDAIPVDSVPCWVPTVRTSAANGQSTRGPSNIFAPLLNDGRRFAPREPSKLRTSFSLSPEDESRDD